VSMDVLKVTMSVSGREYLLVVQDGFTKWLEAVPMRDTSAETVREALLDIFCRFGMPRFLHSDQGSNFESAVISNLCQAFDIQKTRTTPYHPQGDGMTERANRTLLTMLRTACLRSAGQWEKHLPMLLFAYRTTRHQATGYSPFELMFGRTPPGLDNFAERAVCFGTTPSAHLQSLSETMTEFREMVDAHTAQSAEEAQRHRRFQLPPEYSPGDPVWLWDNNPRHKLAPRWLGGWRVDTMLGPVTVRIANDAGHRKVVHIDKLKMRVPRAPVLDGPERDTVWMETEHSSNVQAATKEPQQTTQPDPSLVEVGISHEVAETQPLRVSARERQPPARLADYVLY